MKKTALVVVIIAAVALIVGTQSVLAAKPGPVNGIAHGQVTNFGTYAEWTPAFDTPASGPWKVVVNLKTNHVSFTATCKDATTGVVYKVSYIGPGTLSDDTITIPEITIKSAGVSQLLGKYGTDIIVGATTLTVNIYAKGGSTNINITGTVRWRKFVP